MYCRWPGRAHEADRFDRVLAGFEEPPKMRNTPFLFSTWLLCLASPSSAQIPWQTEAEKEKYRRYQQIQVEQIEKHKRDYYNMGKGLKPPQPPPSPYNYSSSKSTKLRPSAPAAASPSAVERAPAAVRNPLQKAAAKGDYASVRALLGEGADPNSLDSAGNSALHLSAAVGDWRSLEALIGNGAQLDLANKTGQTALHLAARSGFLEATELLLKAGAQQLKDANGQTPLDLARKSSQGSAREVQAALMR